MGVQFVDNENLTGSFKHCGKSTVENWYKVEIVKKLKLVDLSYIQDFQNTAFIKDMFSSMMEVAKFEGPD